MQAHKIETVIEQNGKLILNGLPFKAGDTVEIIILETNSKRKNENPYSLRGTPYKYEDPFEPAVPPEDWEALK